MQYAKYAVGLVALCAGGYFYNEAYKASATGGVPAALSYFSDSSPLDEVNNLLDNLSPVEIEARAPAASARFSLKPQQIETSTTFAPEPQVRLYKVYIYRQGDNHGQVDEREPLFARFEAKVAGPTSKVVVLRNGQTVRNFSVKPSPNGLQLITVPQISAEGVFSVRIFSKDGRIRETSYVFTKRLRETGWSYNRGINTYYLKMPYRFGDSKLDAYFRYLG